jgi:hypothetical protein
VHRPARVGLATIGVAAALILTLDVIYATEFALVRRTISQHQLGPTGWVFGVAMALLAAGSVAIVVSLVRQRLSSASSAGVAALLVWSAGLLIVGVFPKHDWSVGPSMSGSIHRAAGFVAFLSLPLAALLIAVPWWRHPRWRRPARLVTALGAASMVWIAGVAMVIVPATMDGQRWYRVLPLGVVERGLALLEVATLIALGIWAASRAQRSRNRESQTPRAAGPVGAVETISSARSIKSTESA